MAEYAVPIITSLFGGLLGKKQNPTLDPNELQRLFGPGQISKETQQLYAMLANSPMFSQMMNSAAIQGTRTRNATQANLGRTGLSSTPYGGFLNAAGAGYGASLQRGAKADLFMKALQSAMEGISQRQSLYAQSRGMRQEQPTWQRMIGASLLNAGGTGFQNLFKPKGGGDGGGGGWWGGMGADESGPPQWMTGKPQQ